MSPAQMFVTFVVIPAATGLALWAGALVSTLFDPRDPS